MNRNEEKEMNRNEQKDDERIAERKRRNAEGKPKIFKKK